MVLARGGRFYAATQAWHAVSIPFITRQRVHY
jgi:hypothetical protein